MSDDENCPDLQIDRCWVYWSNIGGHLFYVCFSPVASCPIGLVWGISKAAGNAGKTQFEVAFSYVLPQFRRQGVRTKLNEQILEHWDVIVSQDGTDEGGKAFMQATGYKLNKTIGAWYLTRAAWKRAKRRRDSEVS